MQRIDPKIFKKIQKGSLQLKRFKYYLSLYGVGVYFWMSYLWDLLLINLKIIDETRENWFYQLVFNEHPTKLYPIIDFISLVEMIIFIFLTAYVVLWIYSDTYCRIEEGEENISFKKQLKKAFIFNLLIYLILRIFSFIYFA